MPYAIRVDVYDDDDEHLGKIYITEIPNDRNFKYLYDSGALVGHKFREILKAIYTGCHYFIDEGEIHYIEEEEDEEGYHDGKRDYSRDGVVANDGSGVSIPWQCLEC